MICLHHLFLPWLTLWQLSGHPDGLALAQAAAMFEVPRSLMWSTAWAETRHAVDNTQVSRAGATGRMQILPRAWSWQCGDVLGPRRYERNIYCGALVLRVYLSRCAEDQRCAADHYVGGDTLYAGRVARHALLYELQAAQAANVALSASR